LKQKPASRGYLAELSAAQTLPEISASVNDEYDAEREASPALRDHRGGGSAGAGASARQLSCSLMAQDCVERTASLMLHALDDTDGSGPGSGGSDTDSEAGSADSDTGSADSGPGSSPGSAKVSGSDMVKCEHMGRGVRPALIIFPRLSVHV
jgi:hypothetical protein